MYGHRPLSISSYSPASPATSTIEVALSGRYVAASRYEFAPPLGGTTLKVVDLLHRRTVSQPPPSTTQSRDIRVSDIVLRGRSVAWIASVVHIDSSTGQTFSTSEVHRLDRNGATVLDSGRDIAPGSLGLSLDGSRIYWMNAGSAHNADLQ